MKDLFALSDLISLVYSKFCECFIWDISYIIYDLYLNIIRLSIKMIAQGQGLINTFLNLNIILL